MLLSQKISFQPAEGKLIVVVPCGTKSNRKPKNHNFGCDETVLAQVLKVLVQALDLSVWGLKDISKGRMGCDPHKTRNKTSSPPWTTCAGIVQLDLQNFIMEIHVFFSFFQIHGDSQSRIQATWQNFACQKKSLTSVQKRYWIVELEKFIWVFAKNRGTPKWMVYNGTPH